MDVNLFYGEVNLHFLNRVLIVVRDDRDLAYIRTGFHTGRVDIQYDRTLLAGLHALARFDINRVVGAVYATDLERVSTAVLNWEDIFQTLT